MIFYEVCSFVCQVYLDKQDQLIFLMSWLGFYLRSSDIKVQNMV